MGVFSKETFSQIKEILVREVVSQRVRYPALIFIVFLILLPLITQDPALLQTFIYANLMAVFASSWDLISGYTNQISFGHALFFGIAAYTSALLNLYFNWSPWLVIPMGGFMAMLVALVIGIACLRWKSQEYLIFATLMFPTLVIALIVMFPRITGGTEGLPGNLFQKFGRVIDPISSSISVEYYVSLLLMLAAVCFMIIVAYSKIGLIFQSIRENEPAAEAAGINTTKYKILAFLISAFFAGLVGAFNVHSSIVAGTIYNPNAVLGVTLTFSAMLMCIVGGIASITGAVGGAYVIVFMDESLNRLGLYFPIIAQVKPMIYGVILGVIFFVLPDGVFRRLYYYIRYGTTEV
jgi:branched-chain amino acid transport system permease protein